MSIQRAQRAIRNLGGFSGGTSRLARPWTVLEEPDVKPGTTCFEAIGAAFDDVAWDGDDIWQLDASGATGGTPTAPTFTRYDLGYNVVDSGGGAVTESQYSAALSFTADGAGSLWWAETATTSAAFPSPALTYGIAVYRHDIATNTNTQILTIDAPGATSSPNRKFHTVTGLEWREADGRIYLAWDYSRGAAPYWAIASLLPDGSDYTEHLSGTEAFPEYPGPLVFDPDEVSLWCRARNGSGFPLQYQIGHIDLTSFTATEDPTSGQSIARQPGIPTAEGLTFSPSGGWKVVHYDDPGFTVTDSECEDATNIGDVAYEQAPWGRTAFGAAQLYVHV